MRRRVVLLFDQQRFERPLDLVVLVSFGTASSTIIGVVHCRQCTTKRAKTHQSPSGCRFTTRVRLLIKSELVGRWYWVVDQPYEIPDAAAERAHTLRQVAHRDVVADVGFPGPNGFFALADRGGEFGLG
jgi:hypothetical protein